MARLIPVNNVDTSVENTEEEKPKVLKLVPVQKTETTTTLTPVKPERTKIEQPLLKEANSTSIKDVPEALIQIAKGMIDVGAGITAFAGGSMVDTYNILTGKAQQGDVNARKALDYVNNVSNGVYNKVRSLVPFGDQKGAEQIVNNIFSPLEKLATKGGEAVTDLTGSPVAGATTYATLQVLPFVLGGKAVEAIKKPKVPVSDLSYAKELESNIIENPKQSILDAKSAIIDNVVEKAKEIDSNPQVAQEIQTLKQVSDSLGIANAGEIPEGQSIILGTQKFQATNNIKEYGKSIAAIKDDAVKTIESLSKEQRRDLIRERVEAYKRKKELESISHYEDTPDPLTVDTNETIQNTLYKDAENKKAITLKDVNGIAKNKEMDVVSNVGANGDLNISVKDKYGNTASFPLGENGVELSHVHDYVKNWTDSFAQSQQTKYEILSDVIDNAPELVAKSGKTKKHIIKQTGETIEYQTVGDLKAEYEARGLPWTTDKKAYYTKKKLDEATKAEIDDKLTPISQKSLPEIELLDTVGNGKKPGIMQWAEPFRFVAQDIEMRTGFPMQQFESKIRDGMRQSYTSIVPYMKRLKDAKRGMNYESSVRIYKALESPAFRESGGDYLTFRQNIKKDQALSNLFGDMSRSEYDSAGKIRKILNNAAEEFGVPVDKMVMDYAPRMLREGVSGWEEAIKKWSLPEEYKWAALEERSGYMRPHEENIFKVADSYLRRGSQKRYVGNHLEELSNQLNKTKFESKADIDQLNRYVSTMRGWQTGFDESIRSTGETLARGLNKAINKSLEFVHMEPSQRYRNASFRKVDVEHNVINKETGASEKVITPKFIKTGEAPGFFDINSAANDLINIHLKLSYAGALAFRPMVWARATYQSTLSLPIVGPYWYAKGLSKLKSPEAWADAKAATALLQQPVVAGGELSQGWSLLDDVTRISTYDTQSGHNVGRLISYHAAKEKFAYYGQKFIDDVASGMKEDKAISKFIDKSGADFFHPVLIKNEIIPLLKAKDVTSLSERMGLHTTAETQWLYEKGQSPYWARSTAGRVLGQFGVWPSWYIKYARNLATRGSTTNIAKRLAGLTAINGISYEIGKEVFGVDISGWTLSHPFMWFPLPVQTWDAARKMLGGKSDYEKEQGKNTLMNMAGMHIPGYLAVQSVIQGMEETRDEDKIKKILGFKPAEE